MRSEVDWTETFPDGVSVRLKRLSRSVLISDVKCQHPLDELPTVTRHYANRALDLTSIRAAGSYRLADVTSPYTCWVPASNGPRCASRSRLRPPLR